MTESQVEDLKKIRRKNKGTALTQRIVSALAKEFEQARSESYTVDELLTEWEVRGWKSFKADWMTKRVNNETHQYNNQCFADQITEQVEYGIQALEQGDGTGNDENFLDIL